MAIYRGFSTANHLQNGGRSFAATDIELVKRDLLNHIYTVPGERVMQPNFGTRIPSLAFEPLDSSTVSIVETDLRSVFRYDPRVEVLGMSVNALPDNNAIVALVDLLYVQLDVKETLRLEFPFKA